MDVHVNHIVLVVASCLDSKQELHGQQASIMLSSLKMITLLYNEVTFALLCRKRVFIVG